MRTVTQHDDGSMEPATQALYYLARYRERPLIGFALGTLTFIVATLFRFWIDRHLPPGFPFLTFFPAVIVTSYIAGWKPAILTAGLSTLAAWYWFTPPYGSFHLEGATGLAIGFFAAVVSAIIFVVHQMQDALIRLAQERQQSQRLYELQAAMFQELQHRVANNMMFVSSLIGMHRQQAKTEPSLAVAALDEAQSRIAVMSRIHRRLYDPALIQGSLDQYFREMAQDLLNATGSQNISFAIKVDDIRFEISRLTTVSLILAEVITNSLKHAFRGRDRGSIAVTLALTGQSQVVLTIADDGVGLANTAGTEAGSGLGRLIIDSLCEQLDGSLAISSERGKGTRTELRFSL